MQNRTFQVVDLAPTPVVFHRVRQPLSALCMSMGDLFAGVLDAVARAGGAPAGTHYARFHSVVPEAFDVEIGLPVVRPVAVVAPFGAGTLPGGRVATLLHVGPYEQLPESWNVLSSRIAATGEKLADCWEVYLTDPVTEPDPARWMTRLYGTLEPA